LAYPLLKSRLGFAIAVAASSLLVGVGCFSDPVNMRPTVRIDTPRTSDGQLADPFFRGTKLLYTATASDPDGDVPTVVWQLVTGDGCQPGFDSPEKWPKGSWSPQMVVQPGDTQGPFCVWAKATDSHGAAAVDARTGDPQDHPPVAVLALASPAPARSFPPGTSFQLSAASSHDDDPGDTLSFYWTLQSSPSATAAIVDCTTGAVVSPSVPSGPVQCITGDTPGPYQIEVTATDKSDRSSTADMTLEIERGPLPVGAIDLLLPSGPGPFKLDQPMRVSCKSSSFGGLAMHDCGWSLLSPPGSMNPGTPGRCDGDSTTDTACFVADVSGDYHVTLTVTTAAGDSIPVMAKFTVAPDQPPCLIATSPDLSLPMTTIMSSTMGMSTMAEFDVTTVDDDLDPVPGAGVHDIEWFVSVNKGAFMLMSTGFASFQLPGTFTFAQDVRVRVQIHDRDTDRSAQEFLNCGDDADKCSLPSMFDPDGCIQRKTWAVQILPQPVQP